MSAPELCVADDATFWPWRRWPEFAAWPGKERTVVVLPIAGMADWGLGHAFDAEETVLMHVLREASRRRPADLDLLVAPPLRFVFGPAPGCVFAGDPPLAQALLADWVGSIAASGFRRVVLFNASPWNEEICAAASRDLRLSHNLLVGRIHLSGLGLDFHPVRSPDRRRVQTLLTGLTGLEPPEQAGPAPAPEWGAENVSPLAGRPASLAEARAEAQAILAEPAERLLSLLGEIQARPLPTARFGA